MTRRRPSDERFEEAAQLRDSLRTVQTLRDRQQKMADGRVRASRRVRPQARARGRRHPGVSGPERPRGRANRARHRGGDRRIDRRAKCSRRRCSSSTNCGWRRPRFTCPAEPDEREALETWLSVAGRPPRARRRCRSAAKSAGSWSWRTRNAALAYNTRFNQATAAQYDALATLQSVLALPALPRRIECFDISTIQGSDTVASMVVCEDGRMRRGEYRKYRISGLGLGAGGSGIPEPPSLQPPSPEPQSTNDFAAMHEVVLRRYREAARAGRAVPRSDRHRRRQGAAVRGVRRARGARPGESRGDRHRQEGGAALHARARRSDRAGAQRLRRCCWCSACATKPIASPSPSTGRPGRCAICDRSSTMCQASGSGAGGSC